MTRNTFDIDSFPSKLHALCALAMARNRTPDAAAVVIETLISTLGFTIALATNGNPKLMNEMCEGASAYLFESCSEKQRAGEVLGHTKA